MTRDIAIRYCDEYLARNISDIDKEFLKIAKEALQQQPCEDEYIKVPKKALKYRTAGMVAYNAEWLKNHFDIERAVICGVQEPCEDAVSRKAVITVVKDWWGKGAIAIDDIRNLPSVTPTKCIATVKFSKEDMQELVNEKMKDIVVERKKGKWITKFHGFPPEPYTACSNCDYDVDFEISKLVKADAFTIEPYRPNYCPNCGAEME